MIFHVRLATFTLTRAFTFGLNILRKMRVTWESVSTNFEVIVLCSTNNLVILAKIRRSKYDRFASMYYHAVVSIYSLKLTMET